MTPAFSNRVSSDSSRPRIWVFRKRSSRGACSTSPVLAGCANPNPSCALLSKRRVSPPIATTSPVPFDHAVRAATITLIKKSTASFQGEDQGEGPYQSCAAYPDQRMTLSSFIRRRAPPASPQSFATQVRSPGTPHGPKSATPSYPLFSQKNQFALRPFLFPLRKRVVRRRARFSTDVRDSRNRQ